MVLLGEHPLVLIPFSNVALGYGDATKDQVGSSACKLICLGQRQTRVVQSATWGADENADVSAGH